MNFYSIYWLKVLRKEWIIYIHRFFNILVKLRVYFFTIIYCSLQKLSRRGKKSGEKELKERIWSEQSCWENNVLFWFAKNSAIQPQSDNGVGDWNFSGRRSQGSRQGPASCRRRNPSADHDARPVLRPRPRSPS